MDYPHVDTSSYDFSSHDAAPAEADDPIADPADQPDEADSFAADTLAYYAAKAEVARLAARLGIATGKEGARAAGRGDCPTGFGRGWIPLERDIGLPGDELGSPVSREAGRTHRSTDFTPDRRSRFLHVLAEQGDVRLACAQVGIAAQTAYLARRRDAAFGAGWAAALVLAREHAEQVLANRALDGVREPVFYRGEQIGMKVRHDARLLLAHLGRLDARCADPQAVAHAERFDEILALVAGADYAPGLRDRPRGAGGLAPDPVLPASRERHVANRGAEAAAAVRWGAHAGEAEPYEAGQDAAEVSPVEAADLAARAAAEVEWDLWEDRVESVAAVLAAGALPVVAQDEAEQAEGEAVKEAKVEELPTGILPGTGRGTTTRSGVVEGACGRAQHWPEGPLHHPADGPPPRPGEDLEPETATPSLVSLSPACAAAEPAPEPAPEAPERAEPEAAARPVPRTGPRIYVF